MKSNYTTLLHNIKYRGTATVIDPDTDYSNRKEERAGHYLSNKMLPYKTRLHSTQYWKDWIKDNEEKGFI